MSCIHLVTWDFHWWNPLTHYFLWQVWSVRVFLNRCTSLSAASKPPVWTSSTCMLLTAAPPLRRHWRHANNSMRVGHSQSGNICWPWAGKWVAIFVCCAEGVFKELGLCNYASWEVVSSLSPFSHCCVSTVSCSMPHRLMSTTPARGMAGCCPLSTRACTMRSQGEGPPQG